MSVFNSKAFKELNQQWEKKLAEHGFNDIESRANFRYSSNPRSQAFIHHLLIRDFFLTLDWLLANDEAMPKFDRAVLTKYSQGMKVTQIAREHFKSRTHVNNVIFRYKGLIKLLQKMQSSES